MSDLSGILSLAGQALITQQQAIRVTSHNIANVNTPGYSRQRLHLSTNTPVFTAMGPLGNGVRAVSIERIYDLFISDQINNENQEMGRWDAQRNAVEMVEMIFNESDGYGLSTAMNKYWDAWQSLTNNPAGSTERQVLITASQVLATTFNQLDMDLNQSQHGLDLAVEGTVADINRLTEQLSDLNLKITSAEVGTSNANDFRDQREQLLKELSELIDINTFEDANGTISVLLANGRPLVGAGHTWQLTTQVNASGLQEVYWVDNFGNTTNINSSIAGGKLKGLLAVRDNIIPDAMNRLDTLAQALITDVNTLHTSGFDLNRVAGQDFFNGTSASDIELNPNIAADADLIAAASAAASVPGDNSKAIEIANLQYQLSMSGNTVTYNDYYSALIRDVGNEVLISHAYYHHQSDMLSQLENRRESVSGVSLDEEMINLMRFQNAYAAAAKMVTAADEMLKTVIQMV